MVEHARLGLSNTRWPHCPGEPRESAKYPRETNIYAIDGTGDHIYLEKCIIEDKEPAEFLGQTLGVGHPDKPEGWLIKQDRLDRVQVAIDYIDKRFLDADYIKIYSEQRINPGVLYGRDDWWGTLDICMFNQTFLEVADYKGGNGYVSEKANTQLVGCAVGAVALVEKEHGCKIETIRVTIIQPKTGEPRWREYTREELDAEAAKLAHAASLTDDPNAPLIAGDHCTWCKHGRAGNCAAKLEKAGEGLQNLVPAQTPILKTPIPVTRMSSDQLARIKDNELFVLEILDQVNTEIMSRIEKGDTVPGYAIGEGRKTKAWKLSEEEIAKKLRGFRIKKDDVFPASLITPAQTLELECLTERQKQKIIDNMIEEKTGKKKLYKVKREQPTIAEMFGNVPKQQDLRKKYNFM